MDSTKGHTFNPNINPNVEYLEMDGELLKVRCFQELGQWLVFVGQSHRGTFDSYNDARTRMETTIENLIHRGAKVVYNRVI